jgi:PIN domain nuclease of toxin-antitoxin system
LKLLLDTHALLWFGLNDPQLSGTAMSLIKDSAN